MTTARDRRLALLARYGWPWLLVAIVGGFCALGLHSYLDHERGVEPLVWRSKRALWLLPAAGLVGVIVFHLQRMRGAAMGFSRVELIKSRGMTAWLTELPGALAVVGVGALVVALAQPQTDRTVTHEVDSIDIMIVVDMSRSMEETDIPLTRIDAAQRVIRRFLHRTHNDRIGLVVFGQKAMLECPLTNDAKMLERIVADLTLGDVPALGTAIGDGLALALAQLRRSDAKSKVVILLSDGDSNWVTRFEPDEAAHAAAQMGVKVYTLLVGREESDMFGTMSVNPATLRSIAQITGGEFFRATDYDSFDHGFQSVRSKLDTTKRTITERIPDKQMFQAIAIVGAVLLFLGFALAHGPLRRLP